MSGEASFEIVIYEDVDLLSYVRSSEGFMDGLAQELGGSY